MNNDCGKKDKDKMIYSLHLMYTLRFFDKEVKGEGDCCTPILKCMFNSFE